jgi:hypothetical protein
MRVRWGSLMDSFCFGDPPLHPLKRGYTLIRLAIFEFVKYNRPQLPILHLFCTSIRQVTERTQARPWG